MLQAGKHQKTKDKKVGALKQFTYREKSPKIDFVTKQRQFIKQRTAGIIYYNQN